MVDIPEEDDVAPQPPALPRPETDSSRRPTAKNLLGDQKSPDRKKTNPVNEAQGPKRRTQILSLEPPNRNRGTQLSRGGRMDAAGGGQTNSQRQRALMGNIGRQKTQPIVKGPAPGKSTTKPQLRKADHGKPVDLGGSNKKVMETMIQRRRTTRIIPKDGDMTGDTAPLESMRPISAPAAPSLRLRNNNVPPLVKIPIPQPSTQRRRDAAPPPLGARGNTLAGVTAEELLGEEGRAMLQQMRLREEQLQRNPAYNQPQRPGTPLGPRMHDSSLVAFQSAEYAAEQAMQDAATDDDELEPQGSFLSGPTKQVRREVMQTPMPAQQEGYDQPPPDDLGYERPVDYGQNSDQDPQARESLAHEEMEQRAGYLLWLQGVITREEVDDSLAAQADVSEGARRLLEDSQFTDQVTLYRFLSRHETLSPVDLETIKPTDRALAALRPAIARSYRVVPLERVGELLLVAATWPLDPKRLLELRRLTSSKVKLFIVTEQEIDAALLQYYPNASPTMRSPAVSDRTDSGDETTAEVTGEALERRYDPTLSGEESGLYPPIQENTYYPVSGIGLTEREASDPDFDAQAATGEHPSVRSESSVADMDQDIALEAADELDLGSPQQRKQETRPEDLDPFGE